MTSPTAVFVRSQDKTLGEEQVRKEFKSFGRIIGLQFSCGHGFLLYEQARDAIDSVNVLNGRRGWTVELAEESSGDMALRFQTEKVRGMLGQFGRILDEEQDKVENERLRLAQQPVVAQDNVLLWDQEFSERVRKAVMKVKEIGAVVTLYESEIKKMMPLIPEMWQNGMREEWTLLQARAVDISAGAFNNMRRTIDPAAE